MGLLLRQPDKKLQLTKLEIQYLVAYLDKSKSVGFIGVNFYKCQRDREELYQFSLLTLCEKLMTKLFNNAHSITEKKISFPINFAEEKTLLAMFQRVDCDSYLLAMQSKILLSLRPLKVLTEI
jgi:hypothetical protein